MSSGKLRTIALANIITSVVRAHTGTQTLQEHRVTQARRALAAPARASGRKVEGEMMVVAHQVAGAKRPDDYIFARGRHHQRSAFSAVARAKFTPGTDQRSSSSGQRPAYSYIYILHLAFQGQPETINTFPRRAVRAAEHRRTCRNSKFLQR